MTESIESVLYAEDDPDDVLFFKEALMKFDSRINLIVVGNGEEVLDELKRTQGIFLFLDINMPVMDGLKCLRQIRKKLARKVPVAIISTSQMMRDEAINQGADFYFLKPIDQDKWDDIFSKVFTVHQPLKKQK